MSWPGVFDPPPSCSCGHRPHDGACPGHITVGKGKDQRRADCPCARVAQNSNNDPRC